MSDVVALREPTTLPDRHMDYRSLMALAKELVTTGFLPMAIKTPAQAVAIILTGQELGLPPMKSLRLINVIQGKPCLAAELQLALFKQRGGRAQWVESDDKLATINLTHPNGDTHTETFTMADAERAGLTKKGGNWTTYPKIMLRWRAASNGLKAIAPDILSGVYDPDEMGAIVDVQTGEVLELPVETRPTPLPQQAEEAKVPTLNVISNPQRQRLWAICKEAKVSEETVKAYLAEEYGIGSSSSIQREWYEAICEWAQSQTKKAEG